MSSTVGCWSKPVTPACETQRLNSLKHYAVLPDTVEHFYDTFTNLAKSLTQADASVLSFITQDAQWNKSQTLPGAHKISRELSIDANLVGDSLEFLHLSDMEKDARFVNHPRILTGEKIHAYLGVAIHDPSGLILGVLSVYKTVAHEFSSANLEHLKVLAQQVELIIAQPNDVAVNHSQRSLSSNVANKPKDITSANVTKSYSYIESMQTFIREVKSSIGKTQNIAGAQGQILVLEIQNYHYLDTVYGSDFIHYLELKVQDRLINTLPKTCIAGSFKDGQFGVYLSAELHLSEIDYIFTLRKNIESPIEYSGRQIYINIKMGISTIYSTQKNLEENIDSARKKLGSTGEHSHNSYEQINEYKRLLKRASQIDHVVHNAVNQNVFTLVYEPIVETQTQMIMGMEALVKWRWKPTEILSPSEFISMSKSDGIIKIPCKMILRTACLEFAGLQKEYLAPLFLSVNISPYEIVTEDFVHNVFNALHEAKLHPAQLQLEVTEQGLFTDFALIVEKLEQLSQAGIRIAIDGFGTRHSPLQYLQHLPIDTVKINQSFIEQIDTNGKGTPILEAIIALSHEMGVQLTAEGIKKWHQAKYVTDNNIVTAQGFYYAKPQSIKETLLSLTNDNFV